MKIKDILSEGNPDQDFSKDKNAELRELLSGAEDTGNPNIMVVTLK